MRSYWIQKIKQTFFFFLGIGYLSLFWGCPSTLYSRKELGGRDPHKDLVASPILSLLKTTRSTSLSVRGVRLNDNMKRVYQLWGKPSSILNYVYVWKDQKGNYLTRIIAQKKTTQKTNSSPHPSNKFSYRLPILKNTNPKELKSLIVRQIDLFFGYKRYLHPKNRALLTPKKINLPTWRTKILGSKGMLKQDGIRQFFIYKKQHFRFLLIKTPLPKGYQLSIVFSLLS